MFRSNVYIAFLAILLPLVTGNFYVQEHTETHEICQDSQISTGSKIECTLKCRYRKKKALFTSQQECFCVPLIIEGECTEEKKKIEGSFLEHHEPMKCPMGFTGDKCDRYTGPGTSWDDPVDSCKQIKEKHAEASSGFYWVQFPLKVIHVYCEMQTQGGGWMLLGNITTTSESQAATLTYKVARSFEYNALSKLYKGDTVLDGSLFPDIGKRMDWTQFRIFCTKPYHRRVFHVINKVTPRGLDFRDYVLGKDVKWLSKPEDCPEAILRLPDDTSILTKACLEKSEYIRSQDIYGKAARLYDHVIFEHGNAHVQLFENSRMECDDFQPKHTQIPGNYNQIGQWLYYVR